MPPNIFFLFCTTDTNSILLMQLLCFHKTIGLQVSSIIEEEDMENGTITEKDVGKIFFVYIPCMPCIPCICTYRISICAVFAFAFNVVSH